MLYISKSNILSVGVFSTEKIFKNQFIILIVKDYTLFPNITITPFGSKINHSFDPNTYLITDSQNCYLYALKDIDIGIELTSNYNMSPWFLKKAEKHYI
jgi:SET domain-containing protein